MELEICTPSVQSAINAQKGGADRIELCANLEQGGTTPSAGTIGLVRKFLEIEVFALIRPRAGDFIYSPMELQEMKADILYCKEKGIDGVVFGVLNKKNEIDIQANRLLASLARPMQITFHRAFDCLENPFEGVEKLIDIGFERILTSGLKPRAVEAIPLIRQLIEQANDRIVIMPGSGLNSKNLKDFLVDTRATEVHASAKKVVSPGDQSLFSAPRFETDETEVKKLAEIIDLI